MAQSVGSRLMSLCIDYLIMYADVRPQKHNFWTCNLVRLAYFKIKIAADTKNESFLNFENIRDTGE